ncbi:hypothetical protein [Gaoshiqia sp. Z1-71]|uniref:hypothetical protein n=1 Tax=Gaoshiqia hydrogeniformans TaxID=3290090 RepID=UPI003BF8406E
MTKKHFIRIAFPIFLLSIQFIVGYGQVFQGSDTGLNSANQAILDTIRVIQKRTSDIFGEQVSVYEPGDSLETCETNFRNLLKNWHTLNVTNAEDYEFLDFSFVETILDSARYNYYRNYFSGEKPVYFSRRSSGRVGLDGQTAYELYIIPGYIHREFYDPMDLPEKAQKLLSKEFTREARALLEEPFCVDTMKLNLYTFSSYQKDTTIHFDPGGFSSFGISWKSSLWSAASPDSLSQDYFDVFFKHEKDIFELNVADAQDLVLKDLMIQRVIRQMNFTQQVHIGDQVYSVKFDYLGTIYTVYVICNPDSKQVVMDYFFKNITIDTKRNLLNKY